MRALKWLWIIVPLVLLGAVVYWRYGTKAKEEATAAKESKSRQGAPPAVISAIAGPQTIVSVLDVIGTAESPYRVEISPKSAGRIEYLTLREGDTVKKGEVLAKIDPTEVQGQVLQQQAVVAESRSRLAQAQIAQGPSQAGISSQIEQQRAAVASAMANLNQVKKNYDAQVAAADALVSDAQSKVAGAEVQVKSAQIQVASQKANLANATARYNRTNDLYKQGFIAAQDLDDARTAMDVQSSAMNVAQAAVNVAQSAVNSAQASLRGAQSQASIARQKGQADITAARAQVDTANAGLKLASANKAQNPAYQENLKALTADVQASRAQLEQARARLSDTVLTSPINGVITQRSADPGALASPSNPILVVQSFDWVYVVASVTLAQSATVTLGKVCDVLFDALPDETFSGAITQVNPAADPVSRKITFRVRIDNKSGLIKPGMFGRVLVPIKRTKAAVAVPREAINKAPGGKQSVTVVNAKGEAEVRIVRVGQIGPKYGEILEGVKAGETVVTLTYKPIKDGQKVSLEGKQP